MQREVQGSGRDRLTELRPWLLASAAALIAFLTFLPTLGRDFDFVDWDDRGVLLENQGYRGLGPSQLRWMFTSNHYGHYQPITWLTYGLDYVLWGMDPRGYHLTNALLHALNTLLVFFLSLALLRRGFAAASGRTGPLALELAALFAALLFAVHPLRVESVAWATERRDLVSAFFLLLAILAYVRAVPSERPRRAGWIGASLGLYLLSMLGKVGGAPLPFVLLAIDWYPLRRLRAGARGAVLLEKVPYLLVAIGFSIGTVLQQTNRWLVPLERHDLLARTAQAFYGLVFYAWKTVLPTGLSPLHELRMPLNVLEWRFVAAALVVLAAAVALIALRRRCPGALVAGIVYAAMLGPLLGYFQNGPQIVAERYSYLSTHGWVLLGAAGAVLLARVLPRARVVIVAGGAAAVIVLAVMTWRQCGVWKNTEELWTAVLRAEPESSFANNSYAYAVLLERGRTAESVPHFRKALEVNAWNREAWYNLWTALERLGELDERRRAYALGADAPDGELRAEAWYRMGNLELSARQDQSNELARQCYEQSLAIRPGYPQAHVNLALVLLRLGRATEAEGHARAATSIDPALRNGWEALTSALSAQNRIDEAIAAVRRVLQLDPDYPWGHRVLQDLEQRRRVPGAGAQREPQFAGTT